MARIVKDHATRKKEIIDTATTMFFEQGYEAVSIQQIIKKLAIAKGTFYHYFNSKEDLLDAVASAQSAGIYDLLDQILAGEAEPLQKLNDFFQKSQSAKFANRKLMMLLLQVLFKDDNVRLRTRMVSRNIEVTSSRLARLLEEGNQKKAWQIPRPELTARDILVLGSYMNEQLALEKDPMAVSFEMLDRRISHFEQTVECLLGLKAGSVKFVDREQLKGYWNECS